MNNYTLKLSSEACFRKRNKEGTMDEPAKCRNCPKIIMGRPVSSSSFLEGGAGQGLGNPTMGHVYANPIFIHPSITRLRIAIQVQRIFFPWMWRPIVATVCPQLVSEEESEDGRWARNENGDLPSTVKPPFFPSRH